MSDAPLKIKDPCEYWQVKPLQAVTTLIKDGTHGSHERVSSGVPLLSAKNITAHGTISLDESDSRISERDYRFIHSSYELKLNDILLTVVGTLGRSALVSGVDKFTIQRSVAVIRSDINNLLPSFLRYFICDDYFQNQLSLRSNATAQAGVYLGELASIDVQFPSIPEQRKIAKILSTVDNLIEKTQALIDKYHSIKQGMMHDLFTRGVDKNGQLRPSYEEAAHQYKESELGWIPKEWEVATFNNLLGSGDLLGIQDGNHGEIHPKSSDFVDHGVPFVMANNLSDGKIDFDSCHFITHQQYSSLRIGFSKPGDVLLTHKGTIGLAAVVYDDTPEVMLTPQVTYYRVSDVSRIQREYLYYYFLTSTFQSILASLSEQTTRKYLGITEQKKLSIVVPSASEQRAVIEKLSSLFSVVGRERKYLLKLKELKAGLMQDLLTGRVRVKVDA